MNRLIVAVLTLLLSGLAIAQKEIPSPADDYEATVVFSRISCALSFKIAQSNAELAAMGAKSSSAEEDKDKGDYRACIKKQKAALKKTYERFAPTVRKPAARTALKEHYIAALTGLDGIAPKFDERVIDYQRRQNGNETRTDELWTRFQAEQ